VFRVILETTAKSDLRGILRYITETLNAPVTAKRIYRSIKKQIMTLNSMPFRYPLVDDEVFAARGLRKMPAENYFVFYVIDEPHKEVHVLRILYNRREWQNLL
jgi:toxin ParE1/3/4